MCYVKARDVRALVGSGLPDVGAEHPIGCGVYYVGCRVVLGELPSALPVDAAGYGCRGLELCGVLDFVEDYFPLLLDVEDFYVVEGSSVRLLSAAFRVEESLVEDYAVFLDCEDLGLKAGFRHVLVVEGLRVGIFSREERPLFILESIRAFVPFFDECVEVVWY